MSLVKVVSGCVTWVQGDLRRKLAPGEAMLVELACDGFGLGPWNLEPWTSLQALGEMGASWSTEQGLCTVDGDALTRLVILSHDRGLRLHITPSGPRRLKLSIDQRYVREGPTMYRIPTIEAMIADVRRHNPVHELPVRRSLMAPEDRSLRGCIAMEGAPMGGEGSVWSREAVQGLAGQQPGGCSPIVVEEHDGRLRAMAVRSGPVVDATMPLSFSAVSGAGRTRGAPK